MNSIRKHIFYTAVKNSTFDIDKYFRVFALGVSADIKDHLLSSVRLSFFEDKKNLWAFNEKGYKHVSNIHNLSLNTAHLKGSRESKIFSILASLYHEEYHALIDEMQINPNCFKLDILHCQKLDVYIESLDDNKFLMRNYNRMREEVHAEVHGLKRTYEKIKSLNKNFDFSKVDAQQLEAAAFVSENEFDTTFKVNFFKRVEQTSFLDAELDILFQRHPEQVYGMLTRIYDSFGNRKDFRTLVEDYEKIIKSNIEVPSEEITSFYYELLVSPYLKYNEEEKEEILNDAYLSDYVIQALQSKEEKLEETISKLSLKNAVSLNSKIKKEIQKFSLLKELQKIKVELEKINRNEKRGY